ncbi:MAG: tetratricopeptide repeat protein [Candidatus Zixiibacteriota bacterium]
MSDNKCKQCGHTIQANTKFCPECGKPTTAAGVVSKGLNDHLIMIAILIAAAAIFTGYQLIKPNTPPAQHAGGMGSGNAMGMGDQMDMAGFEAQLPEDFDALVSMGNALMDQGNYDMAVACYKKALAENPESADVMVDLATCQHATGNNEAAIETFTKALDMKPDHQIAKFNLGIVYYTLGEDEKAKLWWNTLLSENPPQELKLRTQELMQKLQVN